MPKNPPPVQPLQPLIDTHCHLTAKQFTDDRAEVIAAMKSAGLLAGITIGTGNSDARDCWSLQADHPGYIFVAAGLDPFSSFDAGDGFADELAELKQSLQDKPSVAVGEIGLDYHYDLHPAERQCQQLHQQLELAETLSLPVVIHVREAHPDMIRVLGEHPRVTGVIHSFTGGPSEAEAYLGLGWYLAYNGVVTFKNAEAVREAAKLTPADRLLTETDSPYLAPVPRRGKRCQPAYMTDTARFLAEIRGERAEDIAMWTSTNACTLFALPDLTTLQASNS